MFQELNELFESTTIKPTFEKVHIILALFIFGENLEGIEDIDYINAHGTSTLKNDITETRAINEVFGDRAKEVPVSSNKSMLGHTIAAAGAIEFILTLLGINRSIILPTINYEFPDPKCNLDYVPNKSREVKHDIAISNSFGFGGQNACLCIGKYHG